MSEKYSRSMSHKMRNSFSESSLLHQIFFITQSPWDMKEIGYDLDWKEFTFPYL